MPHISSAGSNESRSLRPKRQDDPLEIYFQQVSRHPVMSPEEERDKARRIVALRDRYWRTVLSYPPFLQPILELARAVLGEDCVPKRTTTAATRARNALAKHRLASKRELYRKRSAEVAACLADADTDGVLADMIAADIASLRNGQTSALNLHIRKPQINSKTFRDYAESVEQTGATLRLVRNDFVTANLRLVATIAHRFRGGGLPLEDLIQAGNEGLIKAVHRYDPERGFRFSTYAAWWIRHGVTRAIVNRGRTVRIPAHLHATHSKLRKTHHDLRSKLGREPTREELAAECGAEPGKVEDAIRAFETRVVSTEQPATEDGSTNVGDTLPDESDPSVSDQLDDATVLQHAFEFIDHLGSLEANILTKRFALDGGRQYTLQEIGNDHGLSRERIRQIQNRALYKLRHMIETGGEAPAFV